MKMKSASNSLKINIQVIFHISIMTKRMNTMELVGLEKILLSDLVIHISKLKLIIILIIIICMNMENGMVKDENN